MSSEQRKPSVSFDMWQRLQRDGDVFAPPLTHQPEKGMFHIELRLNFVVEYLPQQYRMNVRSEKRQGFLHRQELLDDVKVRDTMIRMMKLMPVAEADRERITNIVASKAKLMEDDPSNVGRDVIPILMSFRFFYTQQYNHDLEIAWASRLGRSWQQCMPAMETAVLDLDEVGYDNKAGSCLEDQCPICLVGFSDGEEIIRMPCSHDFHGHCLRRWLEKSHLCPLCRFPLPVCLDTELFCPFQEIDPQRMNKPRVFRKPRMRVSAVRALPPGVRNTRVSAVRNLAHGVGITRFSAVRTLPHGVGITRVSAVRTVPPAVGITIDNQRIIDPLAR